MFHNSEKPQIKTILKILRFRHKIDSDLFRNCLKYLKICLLMKKRDI